MSNIIPIPTVWAEDGTAGAPAAWDRERYARYLEAIVFYEGDQWLARRRRGETRLTVNYARALIRKVASYVFPAPATFSVLGTPDAARRAELALADVIAANDLAHLDVELCVEASVLGDAAVKVTWDPTSRQVVVAAVDPATLSAVWRPDNPRLVDEVTHRYLLTGAAIPRVLGPGIDAAGLERARTYRVVERWTPARWTVEVAGQVVRDDENPYGWIPYVVAANNPRPHEFWGESDLVDLYDVCRELNARLSVLARVLELSGAPIAVLENVDGSDGIAVGPGAKWELPEGAKAYLLDLLGGGGVHLHIDYINLLYRALHDLSETPRTAFGDSGRPLSGAALEVEVQPLVQKVHRKRRMWEGVFRERNARILDLSERFGGLDLGGLRRTATIWPSVLPSDTDSAVRNAVQLVAHGIHSRHTAIATLGGDDPEGELARVIDELAAFSVQPSAVSAPRTKLGMTRKGMRLNGQVLTAER
ncbi:MAG: phage portal protein [Thermomicrobiales bacterium]